MLTQDRKTPMRDGNLIAVPVNADAVIYAGAIVVITPTGYAERGFAAPDVTYVGRAENSVDNTNGNDGDLAVNVRRGMAFKWKNSSTDPVTQAGLGKPCFIQDDETLAATHNGNTLSAAGVVIGIDPDGVWIV